MGKTGITSTLLQHNRQVAAFKIGTRPFPLSLSIYYSALVFVVGREWLYHGILDDRRCVYPFRNLHGRGYTLDNLESLRSFLASELLNLESIRQNHVPSKS